MYIFYRYFIGYQNVYTYITDSSYFIGYQHVYSCSYFIGYIYIYIPAISLAINMYILSAISLAIYIYIYIYIYFPAISLAINRDGSSGGVVRLAAITKDGVERFLLSGDQIPKFYEDS